MLIQNLRQSGLIWLSLQGVAQVDAHHQHGHGHDRFHPHAVRDNLTSSQLTEWITTTNTLGVPVLLGEKPVLPLGSPHPAPAYMKDNVNNFFGSAPDHGSMAGPVLGPINASMISDMHGSLHTRDSDSDDYWLSSLGSNGQMPHAPSGYEFFRNVKHFGAVGDGETDDTAAINRAVSALSSSDHSTARCGKECGSTSTLGAVVYFPEGTYLITTPIVQYYYTQFVGSPSNKPTIKGAKNFTGIALVDSDFYMPDADGAEWYINQSNFYRQIRNFVFDMTCMNWTNTDNNQTYVPAGIHWQVGQATSITNCDFEMSVSTASQSATAVGIYMENGSGGMVSDLSFTGGNIGFLAGSQQFTAINLKFTSCLTAIKSIWNWGFTWKNIHVLSCYIAIDATEYSGVGDQGTGSIAVVDSHFDGVPYAITIAEEKDQQPSVVLDNLLVENSASVVLISGGDTLLDGSTDALYFDSWVSGYQFLPDGSGEKKTGFVNPAPNKPQQLLDSSGAYYRRAKPQYESESPVVATDHGIANDGTGDQASAINSLLSGNLGSVIFFPAGIYQVKSTIKIPAGTKIVGSAWSQLMGTGSEFEDESNPTVLVQVGEKGEQGVVEISDMLFTVKGATAGAILMEWNIHESEQGSAAMWDSHFRVGGTTGSDLGLSECPAKGGGAEKDCMAAFLLLHITDKASGYFENVWAWVADHDIDSPLNAGATESTSGIPQNVQTDISVYCGRGILIESQGPTWLYGTASEHAQMYQYQLQNAANVYMGHMQTETPYYQPKPNALSPYKTGDLPSDPTFADCSDDLCKGAWALRVLNSTDVFIYSAGFYSFFQNYDEGCVDDEDCQQSLIQTNFASNLWMYNIFTKGNVEIVSPEGDLPALRFNSTTRNGFTSEIAAWLALSSGGDTIGSNGDDSGVVYIDPLLWGEPDDDTHVSCNEPCTYVLPPTTLPTPGTWRYPSIVTGIGVGFDVPTNIVYLGNTTSTTTHITTTTTTTISIPPYHGSVVPFWNVVIPPGVNSSVFTPSPSIIHPAFNITWPPFEHGGTSYPGKTVPFYPPPWTPASPTPTPSPGQPTASTSSSSEETKTTKSSKSSSGDETSSGETKTTSGGGGVKTTGGGTKTKGGGDDDNNDGHRPVTHHHGPPKPTCTNRKLCGTSCKEGITGLFNSVFHVCDPCFTNCGGGESPNNDPTNPNDPDREDDPDKDPSSTSTKCSTSTYSSCSTVCVTASSTSSCSSTCRDIVGCDTTGTSTMDGYTLGPIITGTVEVWSGAADDQPSDTTANWYAGKSIYDAETPTASTTVSTITKVILETGTATATVTGTVGWASVVAASRYGPLGNIMTDYNLNFYKPSTTRNVCQAGYWSNYGDGSPKPKAWSYVPERVNFFSIMTVYNDKYSKCIYTNSAAPSAGDGGTLSCDGLSLSCFVSTQSVLGCNADALIGWDTKVKPLIGCPVTSTSTSHYETVSSQKTETVVTTMVHSDY